VAMMVAKAVKMLKRVCRRVISKWLILTLLFLFLFYIIETYRSVLDLILFGGQFRKITKFEDKKPEIDLSANIMVESPNKTLHQIRTINEIKQQLKLQQQSQQQQQQRKRHAHQVSGLEIPEFASVAANQESLIVQAAINDELLQDLFDNVIEPQNSAAKRSSATSLLLSVFCNLYKMEMGPSPAVGQVKSFFIEMLDSPSAEIRSHAFYILYNLFDRLVIQNPDKSKFLEALNFVFFVNTNNVNLLFSH